VSRKALLVGINNFVRPDWKLNGCINDTLDMQEILKLYYGFTDGDIKILHDKDASNEGIRKGLGWLLSDYTGQDVRLFHFSSHGTQVDDDSGDEWECRDEVIVPYDHDWNKPFRDDELRTIFAKIPAGVSFTFIADCCHSGTMQKALLDKGVKFTARFLTPPRDIQDRIDAKVATREADFDNWSSEQLAAMLAKIPQSEWAAKMKEYMKKLRDLYRQNKYAVVDAERDVLLAACEDKQTAADAEISGTYRGAFTWALGQAIRQAGGKLTYGSLIKKTAAKMMEYEQKPQLECPPTLTKKKFLAPLT
jgi:metacaspase-1